MVQLKGIHAIEHSQGFSSEENACTSECGLLDDADLVSTAGGIGWVDGHRFDDYHFDDFEEKFRR